MTLPGVEATAELELARVTIKPPVGAGELIVTVPVTAVVALPLTDAGATVNETSTGAFITRVA